MPVFRLRRESAVSIMGNAKAGNRKHPDIGRARGNSPVTTTVPPDKFVIIAARMNQHKFRETIFFYISICFKRHSYC